MNRQMRVLVAPDKFKGTLTAFEVADIISTSISDIAPDCIVNARPMADGGDGSLELLFSHGYEEVTTAAHDALMRPVRTRYGTRGSHAFIEMAEICGIAAIRREDRDAHRATSFGLGEVVLRAMRDGADSITVSLGGSASTDGGTGFLYALGAKFFSASGEELIPTLSNLIEIATLDLSSVFLGSREVAWEILIDVTNPLVGSHGAAAIFGPQKGLLDGEINSADEALVSWARLLEKATGVATASLPGAGAAGGVAAAFIALLHASVISGSMWFSEKFFLRELIQGCDIVITAEGSFDNQSLMGKTTGEVIRLARECGKPCVVIAGVVSKPIPHLSEVYFYSMAEIAGSFEESFHNGRLWLATASRKVGEERILPFRHA